MVSKWSEGKDDAVSSNDEAGAILCNEKRSRNVERVLNSLGEHRGSRTSMARLDDVTTGGRSERDALNMDMVGGEQMWGAIGLVNDDILNSHAWNRLLGEENEVVHGYIPKPIMKLNSMGGEMRDGGPENNQDVDPIVVNKCTGSNYEVYD